MQLEGETARVVVDGYSTEDGGRCSLVVIQESSGTWSFYPYGVAKLGVRVNIAGARTVADTILAEPTVKR